MRWRLLFLFPCFFAAFPTNVSAELPPDIVVAKDGSGNFSTIQQAVESIAQDNHQRIIVLVKDGIYKEKVRVDASCVTLLGQSRGGTRIEYPQLNSDFEQDPDNLGRAVMNINGDDCVLANLTIANTAGVVGPHEVAVFGLGDRTVTIDCDLLSEGADTVSLWRGRDGRYYHARCNFRGAIDFVCPRGWCYVTDSNFFETNKAAAIWHDGSLDKDMKFVLRNCRFDGVPGWYLGRHKHDAEFFLLDCTFSKSLTDRPILRYPIPATHPSEADARQYAELDQSNVWGERNYFDDCHRDGGDLAWFADNLATAPGSPRPDQITARWTFGRTWDPENKAGPAITGIDARETNTAISYSETVTVKGEPRLVLSDGTFADYAGGSGSNLILFSNPGKLHATSLDLNGGAIIASQASAEIREAELTLPAK